MTASHTSPIAISPSPTTTLAIRDARMAFGPVAQRVHHGRVVLPGRHGQPARAGVAGGATSVAAVWSAR